MNTPEAKAILATELGKYRAKSYASLVALVENTQALEITGPSDAWYQLKFYAAWDDKPNDVLRVFGSIDDGGWRAYFPLTANFLVNQDGVLASE